MGDIAQFSVNGHFVHAAAGGRAHVRGRRLAVFVHGAGLDHTVWAWQSRWLAFRGWNVLALDLPGHGRSAGPPLTDIRAMAEWLIAVISAAGAAAATVIGHSMGSLVALDAAALVPSRIDGLVLIGSAATMPVNADLLAAAQANQQGAIDMVNLWGYGYSAGMGGSPAPGVWMIGTGERILQRAGPGVLYADLAACNGYRDGLAAAGRVSAPTLLVSGERDQMTPLKSARQLAAAIPAARLLILAGAGHMLLAERPDELLDALAEHLGAVPAVHP